LWETEEPCNVIEACRLAWEVVEGTGGSDDATTFLLDLLMECGDWAGAVKLLAQFEGRKTDTWVWCTPLVYFRARGAHSGIAKDAALRAMKANPHVCPLLLQDCGGLAQMGRTGTPQEQMMKVMTGQMDKMAMEANTYYSNFAKHWYREPESIEWLRSLRAAASSGGGRGGGEKGASTSGETGFNAGLVSCSNCSGTSLSGQKLLLCSGCRNARYCGRQCQVEHWKGGHKAACKAASPKTK
jgi:hypothetical protein